MKLALTKDEKRFLAKKYQRELELSNKEAYDLADFKCQEIKLESKHSVKINKKKEEELRKLLNIKY